MESKYRIYLKIDSIGIILRKRRIWVVCQSQKSVHCLMCVQRRCNFLPHVETIVIGGCIHSGIKPSHSLAQMLNSYIYLEPKISAGIFHLCQKTTKKIRGKIYLCIQICLYFYPPPFAPSASAAFLPIT